MKACPVCQAQNTDDAVYCQDCGADLSAAVAAQETPDQSVDPAAASPAAALPVEAETGTAAPVAATGPHLVVASTGQVLPLIKKETIIGREDPISSIFPDIDTAPFGGLEGGVSRKHAKIYEQNGTYYIEDLNSTNYTLVNKQKLEPSTARQLAAGDEIRLGRISLLFMLQ